MFGFGKKKPEETQEVIVGKAGQAISDAIERRKEDTKDISEPVWMIVKALQERPRCFSVTDKYFCAGFYSYSVTDRKTRATFRLSHDILGTRVDGPFALSEDESELLRIEGQKWLLRKRRRVDERKRKRWERIYRASETS